MNRDILVILSIILLVSGGIYMLFGVVPYVHGKIIYVLASQDLDAFKKERELIKSQYFNQCSSVTKKEQVIPENCKSLSIENRTIRDKEIIAETKRQKAEDIIMQKSYPHVIPSAGIFLAGVIALIMSRNAVR